MCEFYPLKELQISFAGAKRKKKYKYQDRGNENQ